MILPRRLKALFNGILINHTNNQLNHHDSSLFLFFYFLCRLCHIRELESWFQSVTVKKLMLITWLWNARRLYLSCEISLYKKKSLLLTFFPTEWVSSPYIKYCKWISRFNQSFVVLCALMELMSIDEWFCIINNCWKWSQERIEDDCRPDQKRKEYERKWDWNMREKIEMECDMPIYNWHYEEIRRDKLVKWTKSEEDDL